MIFRLLFSVSALSCFMTSATYAGDVLEPRFEANMRPGTERNIMMGEFWIPLAQDNNSVLYGDLRLMGDNENAREFNAGLGYRDVVNSEILGRGVFGVHGWFDRRKTPNDNMFTQATAGIEWFGESIDIKSNAYIPLSGDQSFTKANPNGTNGQLVGNQIIVNTDQTLVEEALAGLDLELGWKLDFADDFTDSTRVYAGAYHFEGDRADDVSGWRTRISSDVTSNIQLGARFQRDDVRGSQGFLDLTVRLPFGSKKSYREEGVRARLDESPERDIDIVSNSAVTDAGNNKVLVNDATGAVQNIIVVDSNAGVDGTGTAESPFNLLASAEGAAGENDLIYVIGGGATLSGGITLNDKGQKLIGSGVDMTLDDLGISSSNGASFSASGGVVLPKTTVPVITNAGGHGVSIVAVDDIVLSGLMIDGVSNSGVNITNSDNVIVKDLSIENSGIHGLNILHNDGDTYSLNVNGITVAGSVQHGINVVAQNGSNRLFELTQSTITASGVQGVAILHSGTSSGNVTIHDNVVTNNDRNNIIFTTNDTASGSISVTDNSIDDAQTFNGVLIRANGSSTITNPIVTGNTIMNSSSYGINFDMNTGVNSNITNAVIANNTVTGSTLDGIQLHGSSGTGSIADAAIYNNTTTNNSRSGIRIQADDDTSISASVYNNTAINNASNGIRVSDQSTGDITADLGGGAYSSIGQNAVYNNGTVELYVDLDGGTLKAENNYWGSAAGLDPSELNEVDGMADTDPFLTEAP